MSALALYKRLREAGVDESTAILCAEQFDAEVKIALDAILEPRRAKDRARKASKFPRNSAETVEAAETPALPPSPRTPLPPTRPPEGVSSTREVRAREDAGFARFWAAYPRKVSKADARKAFAKAWRKLPPMDEEPILIGGLERAKASWTEAQFIPHAATWLNGERWQDEPAEVITLTPRKAHERPHTPDAKLAAKQANYERSWTGSERAFGRDGKP